MDDENLSLDDTTVFNSSSVYDNPMLSTSRRARWLRRIFFTDHGGKSLRPWADAIGLEVDKFTFLFCILMSIFFGILMSTLLSPKWTPPVIRHLYSGLIGFGLIVFCFGFSIVHLVAMFTISYLMLQFCPPRRVQTYIFFFCMFYLSVMHLIRMYTDYGAYNLDITTPMMIMVAKMSAVGFSVYDGRGKLPEKVRPHHQELKLVRIPSIIEFFGYGFSFLTSFAGPFCFFTEYNNFIHGRPLRREYTDLSEHRNEHPIVSASRTVAKKSVEIVICTAAYMFLAPRFEMHALLDPQWFQVNSVPFKVAYVTIVGFMERAKYYVTWLLIDVACNLAGLGFRGIDPKTGRARWDAVVNVHIRDIEFGQNIRTVMSGWNVGIATWLRYVVYDRVKFAPVVMTYFYSALWHGFYPGYYIAFVTLALCVSVARWGRRKIRPYFLYKGGAMKLLYDAITMILARATIAYCCPPFVLMGWWPSFVFYRSLYFGGHILLLALFLALPRLPNPPPPPPGFAVEGKERDDEDGGGGGAEKKSRQPRGAAVAVAPARSNASHAAVAAEPTESTVRQRAVPAQQQQQQQQRTDEL